LLGFVALLHGSDSAERIDPFHHEADDVNREGWCGDRAIFFNVRRIARAWEFCRRFGEIFADDDDVAPLGPSFLRAGKDTPNFFTSIVREAMSEDMSATAALRRSLASRETASLEVLLCTCGLRSGAKAKVPLARNRVNFTVPSRGDAVRNSFSVRRALSGPSAV